MTVLIFQAQADGKAAKKASQFRCLLLNFKIQLSSVDLSTHTSTPMVVRYFVAVIVDRSRMCVFSPQFVQSLYFFFSFDTKIAHCWRAKLSHSRRSKESGMESNRKPDTRKHFRSLREGRGIEETARKSAFVPTWHGDGIDGRIMQNLCGIIRTAEHTITWCTVPPTPASVCLADESEFLSRAVRPNACEGFCCLVEFRLQRISNVNQTLLKVVLWHVYRSLFWMCIRRAMQFIRKVVCFRIAG